MIITNKNNHDELILKLITEDQNRYDPGDSDITCTKIIDSPRVVELTRQNKDRIIKDVEDLGPIFFGNAIHYYAETLMMNVPGAITEERYFGEFMGWVISGSADLMWRTTDTLYDYKVTTKGQINSSDRIAKWTAQENINRWLNPNKDSIKHLKILAFAKDAYTVRGDAWFVFIDLPIWTDEEVETYLTERITLHQAAREALPPCEDKWTSPEVFAVMRGTAKRAVKLCNTLEEANQYIADNTILHASIQHRPEEHKRCVNCDVKEWCDEQRL